MQRPSRRAEDAAPPASPPPVAAATACRAVPRKQRSRKKDLEHEVHVSEVQRSLRRCHFERKQEAQHARATARRRELLASLVRRAEEDRLKHEAALTHCVPKPATVADVIGAVLVA